MTTGDAVHVNFGIFFLFVIAVVHHSQCFDVLFDGVQFLRGEYNNTDVKTKVEITITLVDN